MSNKKISRHGGVRPGAGRPKGSGTGPRLEVRREEQLAARVDATTATAFRSLCAAAGMTPSDRLRWLIEMDVLGRIRA